MAFELEYFDGVGQAIETGVFIPVGDLSGLDGTELAAAAVDTEGKAVLALANTLYDTLSPAAFDKLGWSVSKANPISAGPDLINQGFTFTATYVVDLSDSTVGPIPVPTGGDNQDIGKFGLVDIFPNAVKIAADVNTPGAGIVISGSAVAGYGAAYADLNIGAGEDNRAWIAALLNYMAVETTLRSASEASAVVAISRGNPINITPPAALTAAPNPTSGLVAADLPLLVLFTISYGLTVQLLLDQSAQTFDVNHVTA
ncbi:MAG: hypothetical protein ACFB0C_24255 [Leptolyngbyaceae cyanobacterium]